MDQSVKLSFVKKPIPVVVDIDEHSIIEEMSDWGPEMKSTFQDACFQNYKEKVDMIGPEGVPKIRKASEIWKHIEFIHARIDPDVKDTVVFYVVPTWEESEHLEICIKGERVVYIGQFLNYSVGYYEKMKP